MKRVITYIMGVFIAAFGLVTLFLSTSIILDLFDIREKEGNYVLFVVLANFVSSIIYLFAVFGFLKYKKWTSKILLYTVGILVLAFAGLQLHIHSGGIYETKTIGALIMRIAISSGFSILAFLNYKKLRP